MGFDFTLKTKKASEEAEKFQKIEEYKVSDAWYSKLFENCALLDEVIKVDSLMKAGKLEISTTPERYMNGVIKRKL